MSTTTQKPEFRMRSPALLEHWANSAQRHAEAFCDVPDYVLGVEVKPLTPAVFSMLHATSNRFVISSRAPGRDCDVFNFVWFSSPRWCPAAAPFARLRKWWALRRLRFEFGQPWMKWIGRPPDVERYAVIFALAAADIRTIVDQAFADAPGKSKNAARQLFSLEAYLIHEFAVNYGWTPERTRHTPIKQLLQFKRCITTARGIAVQDVGEDDILKAHLEKRLAETAHLRTKKETPCL